MPRRCANPVDAPDALERDLWQRHDTLDPVARLAAPMTIQIARRRRERESARLRAASYRDRHPERILERQREWARRARKENRDRINALRRKSRARSRDLFNRNRRRWAAKTGYMREYMKRWRARRRSEARARARARARAGG